MTRRPIVGLAGSLSRTRPALGLPGAPRPAGFASLHASQRLTQARASVNEAEPNAMVGGSTLVSLLATERRTMEVSLQGAVNPAANGDPHLTDPRPADLPPYFR